MLDIYVYIDVDVINSILQIELHILQSTLSDILRYCILFMSDDITVHAIPGKDALSSIQFLLLSHNIPYTALFL